MKDAVSEDKILFTDRYPKDLVLKICKYNKQLSNSL